MHDRQTVEHVLELAAAGLNASAIARECGVSRSTVRDWLDGRLPRSLRSEGEGCDRGSRCLRDPLMFPSTYAYIVGMYLGDGCISELRRGVHSFRVSLDLRYPELIFECRSMLGILCPDNAVNTVPMSGGKHGVVVQAYSKHWPCLFPQHGPGRKHDRRIELEPWQERIVLEEPERFLRGLLHSDGCRSMNNRGRGSSWQGVRYLFYNRSEDILQLFCAACDRLGIRWTRPNSCTISLAHRADTTRLDEFVGPKL